MNEAAEMEKAPGKGAGDGQQNCIPGGTEPSSEESSEVYGACPVKRKRSTREELAQLKGELYGIVAEQKPMSVRQVFYQGVCRGLIEKSEAGYSKVQRALVEMRLSGELPFHWIADYTRWRNQPNTFDSVEHALEETARSYR